MEGSDHLDGRDGKVHGLEGQWSDPGMTSFPELGVSKGILLDLENETGFHLGKCVFAILC
jgi:hypothetical protein